MYLHLPRNSYSMSSYFAGVTCSALLWFLLLKLSFLNSDIDEMKIVDLKVKSILNH